MRDTGDITPVQLMVSLPADHYTLLRALEVDFWQLQRQHRSEDAATLLLSSIPIPAPQGPIEQRWQWQRWLEMAFQWALQLKGPEACEALVARQLEGGGLPASADELAQAIEAQQKEGRNRLALINLYQQIALLRAEGADASSLYACQVNLVSLLVAEGWVDQAEQTLQPLLHAPAATAEAWKLGGMLAFRLHQLELSATRFQACLAKNPADELALRFLAKLDLDAGRFDSASGYLAALIQRPPGDPQSEAQLRFLVWQQALQSADTQRQLLVDLSQLFDDPYAVEGLDLLHWASSLLPDTAAADALHQQLRKLQLQIQRADPCLKTPWWEQQQMIGLPDTETERPLKLGILGSEGLGMSLPFGPPCAITAALSAQGIEVTWINPASLQPGFRGVEKMRESHFDVVLDLMGWAPGHRQDLLMQRVAPCQLSWPGEGVALAATWIDALLLDRFIAPDPAHLPNRQLVSPGTVFCRGDLPKAEIPPRMENDSFVIGVTAPPARIGRASWFLWAELLRLIPDATILFVGEAYAENVVQANLTASLECLGVRPERIGMLPLVGGKLDPGVLVPLLSQRLDVCVEPLPSGDPLMALQCLWAGVPVVAIGGGALHQRLTSGLLEQLGMDSFVANDNEQYLEIVMETFSNHIIRAELRTSLRSHLEKSLVVDVGQFAADFFALIKEAALISAGNGFRITE